LVCNPLSFCNTFRLMYHSKQSEDYSRFLFLHVCKVVAFALRALRHYADCCPQWWLRLKLLIHLIILMNDKLLTSNAWPKYHLAGQKIHVSLSLRPYFKLDPLSTWTPFITGLDFVKAGCLAICNIPRRAWHNILAQMWKKNLNIF